MDRNKEKDLNPTDWGTGMKHDLGQKVLKSDGFHKVFLYTFIRAMFSPEVTYVTSGENIALMKVLNSQETPRFSLHCIPFSLSLSLSVWFI